MELQAIAVWAKTCKGAKLDRGGPCLRALQATRRYLQHKVENSRQNFNTNRL
jgi:hypothetical protein